MKTYLLFIIGVILFFETFLFLISKTEIGEEPDRVSRFLASPNGFITIVIIVIIIKEMM